ncbi:MAG: thiol reductant ABC exporter subunit CydC [Candidatus Nanopelagicales bacterium]
MNPVRTLWRAMAAHRSELMWAGFLGAAASLSAVALLGTSGWLIATASTQPPVLTLTVAAVMVRFFAISRGALRYVERLVGHDAAFRGLTGLRVQVYEQLERLAPTGLAAFARGDLLTRLVADVDAALDLPLRVVLPWVQAALVSAATVAFLGWLLPGAGVVVAITAIGALALVPWLVARGAARAEARMAGARSDLAAAVVRALDATGEISASGAGPAAASRLADLDGTLTRLNKRESASVGVGGGLGMLVQAAAIVGSIAVAVPAVTSGRIEPVWFAVVALLPLALFDVLAGLPASAVAYQRLRGSARRLQEIADTPSPVEAPVDPVPVPPAFTGLVLSGVGASWRPEDAALTDIGLRVAPGEHLAVVGSSGAGKSTLAAVLMGFLPYTGSIRMSGVELRDADGDDLRRHVGLLSQRAHVFDTTIADNVRIGAPDADDETVAQALDRARLTDWVRSLPDGVDTVVGSFGVGVSGGEGQRIALARLLVAGRRFVVLDEPTEHLDAPTADALTDTLAEVLSETTVVTITHRLLGLEHADRIVVLDGGRIVGQGTHDELMSAGGWYAQQWRLEAERLDLAVLLPGLPLGRAVPGPAA